MIIFIINLAPGRKSTIPLSLRTDHCKNKRTTKYSIEHIVTPSTRLNLFFAFITKKIIFKGKLKQNSPKILKQERYYSSHKLTGDNYQTVEHFKGIRIHPLIKHDIHLIEVILILIWKIKGI